MLLSFDECELDIVFSNFPNDSEQCCKKLLSRWLQKEPHASWDQLHLAISKLANSEFGA